jgi:LemA protein
MGKLALGCVAILVVLAVIVGISFAGTYNRLVTLGQDVDRSWSEVENQYQRRADLVPNLVSTVQGAANFEKETLTAVTEARASVGRATVTPGKAPADAESLARYQAAQDQLGSALQRLLEATRTTAAEGQPELPRPQAQLEDGEPHHRRPAALQRVRPELQHGPEAVPDRLIAGFFSFKEKPYFATTAGASRPRRCSSTPHNNNPAPTAAPAKQPRAQRPEGGAR